MQKATKLLLVALLAGAFTLEADDSKGAMPYGVGLTLNGDRGVVRAIAGIEEGVRIEPYLGFSYINPDIGLSSMRYSVGSTLEFTKKLDEHVLAYYGGFAALEDNGAFEFVAGPLAGAEYGIDAHFSVGAEVRFRIGIGDNAILETDSSLLVRYKF